MGANTKTGFKGFDYMHCDDFARYLEEMAAKGWHFKEWGVGLKFEKGEPENATYAIEVFTKASENDLRPEPHTQEFAEYCEAAGWKLMDAADRRWKRSIYWCTAGWQETSEYKKLFCGSITCCDDVISSFDS